MKIEKGTDSRKPNCEEDACGEYYVMNGYEGNDLANTSSFATLAVKKNTGTVMGYGNNNPEIKGEGIVRVLFWSDKSKKLNRECVDSKDWSSTTCGGTWKMTTDGSKNGGGKRNGKGWYIIGFIWDKDTQYFGFISESNLWASVLKTQDKNLTIDLSKERDKWNGLFNEKFTGLLDTKIGDVKCLNVNDSNWGSLKSQCSGWNNWQGVITIPMGYIGKEQIGNKTLRDAALVIVPVDQIRVKEGN